MASSGCPDTALNGDASASNVSRIVRPAIGVRLTAWSGVSGHDEPMTSATDRARRARITIAVLLAGVVWASLPFLGGLLGGIMLAVLLAPFHRRLAPRLGERRSALLLAFACAALLVAPAALLAVTTIREAPAALDRVIDSSVIARIAAIQLRGIDIGAQLASATKTLIAWASGWTIAAAGSVTHATINLLLALVGLYYLLPDGGRLWRSVRAFIPFSQNGTDHIAERFVSITEAALLGIAVTALSQGLTVGIAFWLLSLPNPLFWACVTGMVSILPVLGSALVWLPAAAVLVFDQRPGAALMMMFIGVVISSNIDNVVRPIVYRRVSGLHPMASLLGAFAGMQVFGFAGLVLGPLALAYCLELVNLYHQEYESP